MSSTIAFHQHLPPEPSTNNQRAICIICQSNTFLFALNQLTAAGKALLAYAARHPAQFALLSLVIAAGLVTIIVPLALGFASVGPVAGTVAAAWQAAIGNVVAGSFFAILQSMTMTGTLIKVGGGLIAVGVVGLAGGTEWARRIHLAKNVHWANRDRWVKLVQVAGLRLGGVEQWAKAKL